MDVLMYIKCVIYGLISISGSYIHMLQHNLDYLKPQLIIKTIQQITPDHPHYIIGIGAVLK